MPATRDGKLWRSQFYYKDWQGVRRKKNKRGFKTKGEADEWERNFLQQQQKNLDISFALLRSWKGERMKQIQIPEQLFMELVKFHLLDMEENLPSIKQGLEAKLDALVMRDLYSKYKTAPTEEEREQARKEYLDKRGVPEKFRW